MTIDSPSAIAVLSASRYRAEALALSLSAYTKQDVVALTEPEPTVLAHSSRVLVEVDASIESAIRLIRHAAARRPDAAVVVLGLVESEESIVKLAEAGANGYIPANASFQEMLSIVHAARAGEFACTPDITYALFSRLAKLARSQGEKVFQASGLTLRERQVMALLTQGLSNKEIGECLGISALTVKNHVHNLLAKVGARDRRVAARLPRFISLNCQ